MSVHQFTKQPFRSKLRINVTPLGYLEPKDDITPVEAIRIQMMLLGMQQKACFFVKEYAEEHNLLRHFIPTL